MLKTIDGGKTFTQRRGARTTATTTTCWIDPKNPQRMIDATTAAWTSRTDGGKTWYAPPLPIAQFYHVHADNRAPYRVMGCMQDLGTRVGAEQQPEAGGIGPGDWHESAAARPATWSPTRPTRTSSTPASTAAS